MQTSELTRKIHAEESYTSMSFKELYQEMEKFMNVLFSSNPHTISHMFVILNCMMDKYLDNTME